MQQSQEQVQMKVWVGVETMHNKINLFTRAWSSCNVSLVHHYRITSLLWLSEHLLFINCIKSEGWGWWREGMNTQRRRKSCIQKILKLIFLKILFHSKIGCKGVNYQSSAPTRSLQKIRKFSIFVFVWLILSIELSVSLTTQSLQISYYLSVLCILILSVYAFWYSVFCYLSVYVFWELSACVHLPYPPLPSLGLVSFPLLHSSIQQRSARADSWGSVCSASGTTLCFRCLLWLCTELHRENGYKNRPKL